MNPFFGRTKEQQKINELKKLDLAKLVVVYGRRRVGKSTLIQHCFRDQRILSFEGLENQSKKLQIEAFMSQLLSQVPNLKVKNKLRSELKNWPASWPISWHDVFDILSSCIDDQKPVAIVLDEFQWMANYRSELIAILKAYWDRFFSKKRNLTLILCGSIASFMIKKVVKSKALYGRVDLELHVEPFKLYETQQMLSSFGKNELLETQMLLGGIPKYLELIQREPSLYLGVENLAFSRNGYFVGEFDRIFTSHFGSNDLYIKIIECLHQYSYGLDRPSLSKYLGVKLGGGFSELLFNLETAGLIRSFIPYSKKENSKLKKYVLIDEYVRFYLSFIKPKLRQIQLSQKNIFSKLMATSDFLSWKGRSFEIVCFNHAIEISKILGFDGVDFKVGPYFNAKSKTIEGVQIDLLFDRADQVITLCEMKYSRSPIGIEVISEVQKKYDFMKQFTRKTIQVVLISNMPPSNALLRKGYFYKHILADEFLNNSVEA